MSTLANKPVADAVDVACTDDELIVTLVDGRRVSAPLEWFPRLLRATPKQRANWRLIGRGVGIHWDDMDEDISVRTLLASWNHKQDNCAPSCFTQVNGYNYGIGVVRSGSWLLQNPLLDGYSATEAYLPSKKIAIAVAVTFVPEAFDSQGNYSNSSDKVFRSIGTYLAPDDAPPPAKNWSRSWRSSRRPRKRHLSENQQPQTKVRRRLMRMLECNEMMSVLS